MLMRTSVDLLIDLIKSTSYNSTQKRVPTTWTAGITTGMSQIPTMTFQFSMLRSMPSNTGQNQLTSMWAWIAPSKKVKRRAKTIKWKLNRILPPRTISMNIPHHLTRLTRKINKMRRRLRLYMSVVSPSRCLWWKVRPRRRTSWCKPSRSSCRNEI